MAAGKIGIINNALIRVGVAAIDSVFDIDEPLARAIVTVYDQTKLLVLDQMEWNFATKARQLAALANDVTFFPLPADCVRVRDVVMPDDTTSTSPRVVLNWRVGVRDSDRGVVVGSDALDVYIGPVTVRYISVVDDTALPPSFADALVCRLILDTVQTVKPDPETKAGARQNYEIALERAKSIDSQQAAPTVYDPNLWTRGYQRGRALFRGSNNISW